MPNPLISVVMNCYNGERYLREAIDSIAAQTYKNWELIFWDNRSTDASAAIVKGYNDSRIRYVLAEEHTSLGYARKLAVEHCFGEFISFLDTDDVYLPENLYRKLEFIERDSAAVAYGGAIYMNETGVERRRRVPRYRSGHLLEPLLRQFDVDVASMLIRSATLKKAGLNFDPCIYGSEEYDLLMQLTVQNTFSVIPEYLARIRHHQTSLTYEVMSRWYEDRIRTLSKILKAFPDVQQKYPGAFREAYARAHYYNARWLVRQRKIPEALRELKALVAVDWRYLSLYWALRVSPDFWNFAHRFLPSSRRLR